MQKNAALFCASLILMLLAAPQAFAQDGDGGHMHYGTMTGPDGDSMDIKYEMSHSDDGVVGAFIVETPDGQEYRLEMHDLSVSEEMVTYYWSPPGADIMITCELASDGEGGWAGDCTDNGEGDTGQMTMGPMMDHDMDHDEDHDDHEGGDYDDSDDDEDDED